MFALAALASDGDPELTNRYVKSVKLAVDLSESTPGQFKLIETPLNSFVLVANVMPDPQPLQQFSGVADADFSSLRLPRLDRLDRVMGRVFDDARSSETSGSLDVQARGCSGCEALAYQTYTAEQWLWALTINKEKIVEEAIEGLADPKNWKGMYPTDPLPLIWLLFNGPASFCSSECCIYEKHYGCRGPVLLPGHMYAPQKDLLSFVNHALKYTKFLYGNFSGTWPEKSLPFDSSRIPRAVSQLKSIDASDTYITQMCLLCHLYRQNAAVASRGTHVGPILVLGGKGAQYITASVRSQRCISTGDYYLLPSYDISAIIRMIQEDGLAKY
ncbi:ORF34 [Retroperitoneal fibromatosis-associated herpesvirus]|uniref:ORF34 n=1 Tax=Retroperitoneal fibromatosis-associated herpesvirus TaxID=111469 RepID=U5NIW0_9GAMA|nr:ORF34 [Retroperitoneal fibromatosis-associated herpesvirus]AGY30716.1 ORF34 [Retroperitoneal fibromatosis-associated herpesvirus]